MRESNFSNPFQNKACVCISAAIYDRRALDCTATLPLINSLNHLAYLTSTSPRIREMVCLDGGLERLIRILRQVPRSPSQPPLRGVITKEMQAVWKWSLAFQCVVNIGVRGSETVRTRVVEAGMVPVAVRVLESYLRVADAIRDERKREARREEAKQRLGRSAEPSDLLAFDALTPTAASASTVRRALRDVTANPPTQDDRQRHEEQQLQHASPWQPTPAPESSNANDSQQHHAMAEASDATQNDETRPTTPAEATLGEFMVSTSDSSSSMSHVQQHQSMDAADPADETVTGTDDVTPIITSLETIVTVGNAAVSPSSSSSSGGAGAGRATGSSGDLSGRPHTASARSALGNGELTNVSSVEDFTASGSGSDGADEAEAGDESDSGNASRAHRRLDFDPAMEGVEDRTTPRPLRRALAPAASEHSRHLQSSLREANAPQSASSPVSESNQPGRSLIRSGHSRVPATPSVLATPTTSMGVSRHLDPSQTPRNAATAPMPIPHAVETTRNTTHVAHGTSQVGERTRPERERETSGSQIHPSDMIYREEEVLLSLQLLAYLSKYAHVRTLFHRDLATLNMLDPLEALEGRQQSNNVSWSPSDAPKKNVFCIAERYTLRSSRTGLSHFASMGESRIAPEIQYWAGVIMRNACRKDEKQGGIRQCANMLCGKWEKQPREFAKCRRCRKAKYCSKQCQSKGWQMGHRFWCSARSDDEPGEGSKDRAKELSNVAGVAATDGGTTALTEDEMQQTGGEHENAAEAADARPPHHHHHHHHHHRHHHHTAGTTHRAASADTGVFQLERAQQLRNEAATSDLSDPLTSETDADALMQHDLRRDAGVNTQDDSGRSIAQQHLRQGVARQLPSSSSHRGHGGYGGLGQGAPTGPSASGRRAVSAIPQHLQLPSSSSHSDQHNDHRLRTTSAASSSADVSDMSEDEMERASRRVLASTVAPAQRSPAGVHLTMLASVYPTNDPVQGDLQVRRRNGSVVGDGTESSGPSNAGGVPTRTDLAGRPLPPPVIARHDGPAELEMAMAPDADLLTLGGRLTPAAADDAEAGVFGRGDFDQMIWRGRTPSLEDNQHHNLAHRRVPRIDVPSHSASTLPSSTSQDSLTDDFAARSDEGISASTSSLSVNLNGQPSTSASASYASSPSMLNSALLLANQDDVGTPRFANASLHAPVARPAHRFASVNAASSAMSSSIAHSAAMAISGAPLSSSPANAGPHARGALMHTFGDWRVRAESPGPSSTQRSSAFHPSTAAFASGSAFRASDRQIGSSGSSSLASAPAAATVSFDALQQHAPSRQETVAGANEGEFVVPRDIQNLFNAVEMQSTPRQALFTPSSSGTDMEVDS